MDEERNLILEVARRHFPHPVPNPGQIEAVVEIVHAFKNGKKHVVVQAPTGIGKSDIATTVHRTLAELATDRFRTTIITATKALQDQYTENDKKIYDLRGRNNYDCPINQGPYNSGSCRTARRRKECSGGAVCPYLAARTQWCNIEDLRLTNNSFQIEAPGALVMMPERRANLIIADECHDLDDSMLEHTKVDMRANEFRNLGFGIEEAVMEFNSLFTMVPSGVMVQITPLMREKLMEFGRRIIMALDDYEAKFKARQGDMNMLGDAMEILERNTEKAALFLTDEVAMWIVETCDPDARTLVLKPIEARQVADFALFRKADKFLHMSATICGFSEYALALGIKPEEVLFLDVPNPIEAKRRAVYATGSVKVSGRDIDYDALTTAIDTILDMHPEENGLIHTVSYMLANEVYKRSRHRDRMFMTKDRNEMVNELRNRKGVVVLSPAIEKGFDAKGDMARFQIVAKVPFPHLGDSLVKYNASNTPGWYPRKTVLRVVQACGRVTRGVTDYGVTYIVDSNLRRLYNDNPTLFPEWFKESVRFVE